MPSRRVRPGTFKFILLGAAFMLLVDMFLMPDKTEIARQQVLEAQKQEMIKEVSISDTPLDESFEFHFPSGERAPREDEAQPIKSAHDFSKAPVFVLPDVQEMDMHEPAEKEISKPQPSPESPQGFKMNNNYSGKPAIAIVIDDVGVSRPLSWKTTELPPPMTLAFLPYAENVEEMVVAAEKNGHEIIVHFPMEPMNPDIDPGPISLLETHSADAFKENLDKGLSAFDGYKGINNHMGSRLTQNKEAMQNLMARLKAENLYFLDSRTIHTSVAAETAFEMRVPYAVRDVFLDHDPSYEGVMRSLGRAEKVALETGQAIAIGHPKENTIQAILDWVPGLEEKGIILVPLSALVVKDFKSETVQEKAASTADKAPDITQTDLEYDPVLELLLAR